MQTTLTLLHSESFPIGRYADALLQESITPRSLASLDSIGSDASSLRVVLIDPGTTGNGKTPAIDSRTAVVGIGLDEQPRWLKDDNVYLHLPENPTPAVLLSAVKRAYQV